ncbi:PREDICTED: uncharacterized protein C12orf76 homolog [Condylura cristata]|uniref:uncharacterized protein C12orf76 homolog n=1 Tax=Condylura cristata TaxID=143302 RepID=UPI00064394A3|nr:PREDICTED: uncharacterized protein C12orf76 homolog [Condylura cristata]
MLALLWRWLCVGLCSLLLGRAEAPSPLEPPERSRPYAVLRGQNLANGPYQDSRSACTTLLPASLLLLGTIFSILLVTVILMAFCVYKPIRRR